MGEEQPKERRALQRWVGRWAVDYTLKLADGTEHPGTMAVEAAPMAKGQGVLMEAVGEVAALGPWEAHALWGFDAEGQEVHWFAVSSMGEVHDHAGRWTDEDTFELEWRGVEEGQEAVERTTFRWASRDEVAMETVVNVGGTLGHTISGTWRRER